MRDKFWRKWQLWPKNVITQILQSLYNFIISTLDVPPDRVINDNKDLSFGVLFKDGDLIPTFSFDTQPDLKKTVGPSPSLLLQALTMSNSNDVINLGEY